MTFSFSRTPTTRRLQFGSASLGSETGISRKMLYQYRRQGSTGNQEHAEYSRGFPEILSREMLPRSETDFLFRCYSIPGLKTAPIRGRP